MKHESQAMDAECCTLPQPSLPKPQRVTAGLASAALFLYLLWGGNPVAAKVALTRIPPIGLAGLRFGLAALCLGLWCGLRREPLRPPRREVRPLLVNGLLFTVQIATFHLGVFWSSASHSAVLVNAFPIFVAVFAHFMLVGDRLSAAKITGILLGFAGVVTVFLDHWGGEPATMVRGDVVLILSAVILGVQNTYFKDLLARISPYQMVFSQMAISLPAFFAYSLAFEGLLRAHPTALVLGALAYQGILVGAVSFTAWAVILRRMPVSKLSVFAFSSPLWGVAFSYLFLGEPLTWMLALGMLMVAVGIGITLGS
jgi:drug/metabolite transporter (DMT)-like permease